MSELYTKSWISNLSGVSDFFFNFREIVFTFAYTIGIIRVPCVTNLTSTLVHRPIIGKVLVKIHRTRVQTLIDHAETRYQWKKNCSFMIKTSLQWNLYTVQECFYYSIPQTMYIKREDTVTSYVHSWWIVI